MTKPFSQACENNKQPILNVLASAFANTKQVLEVGSGTGQHAVHFAKHLPHLQWQTSELPVNHGGINQWIDEQPSANLKRPIELDLTNPWPTIPSDGIFTANTLHIISWPLVINFFTHAGAHLSKQGTLCIYGPFNYNGQFTSQSNADFNLWLKGRDANSGIRDIEAIKQLAKENGLTLQSDNEMPANNRLLAFVKT
ncbi:DUF938 domain-containing protein [Psychrobium sp. 1_MG-2023]|uniref:DUF938 domain-containing protein n=1 Tax=Psychrobium sp. 1_MG-2023 TaxID=3062624 RepID=UPI000C334CF1|nr:DUF938 domain-containing protein [Psychrobium sp. 1_MG-2023]MDP2562906.1 DUF938 domain-containing protein [Psychrobium sp. 1_MG-2023]PKF54706.1 methylase [Alteromonadales bacterium alter-6D02]